jgi:hypothetical protein
LAVVRGIRHPGIGALRTGRVAIVSGLRRKMRDRENSLLKMKPACEPDASSGQVP